MNWHYVDQGQQAGPVTDEQLLQLFQSGKINPDTLVWHEALPEWTTYHQATQGWKPELAPPLPPVSAETVSVPNGNETVCAECGKLFPVSETIRFGKASVCATCKPIFLQKLSEGAQINTGELNHAGFWVRFAAKFVDGLILGVPFVIVYLGVMFPLISHNHGKPPQSLVFLPWILQFGFMGIQMVYQVFFLGKYGATPGKMACKLKVVTADGEKIGYGRAVGRFFSEILSGMVCYYWLHHGGVRQ